MNPALILEGNCGNTLFLRQQGLLPEEQARAIDVMLAGYARRLCYGVAFGMSNIVKALADLRVGVLDADRAVVYTDDGERERIAETIRRAVRVPEVILTLEEYGFDRGAAHKAPETVLHEIANLLVAARSHSAHLWVWTPRLRILRALFNAAGAAFTTRTSAAGRLHVTHVADFPYLPTSDAARTTEFALVELDTILAPIRRPDRKPKALFVASVPRHENPLRFDEELQHALDEAHRARPGLECVTVLAASPANLERWVLDTRPAIFHFAGHATPAGILLQDDAGARREMSYAWLAAVLKSAGGVECVVLNACHSAHGAPAFAGVARHVIALPHPWDDDGAVEFAHAFYLALARATPIPLAFQNARERVVTLDIPTADLPILFDYP